MSFGDGIAAHCADVEARKGAFAALRAFVYAVFIIPGGGGVLRINDIVLVYR